MLSIFFVLTTILITFIIYCYKHSRYWKNRGIPGPPSLPFFGNFFEIVSDAVHETALIREWTKKYGKCYGFQIGRTNVLATSDLNMLRELFLQKYDNFHGRPSRGIGRNPDTAPDVHLFFSRGLRWKRLRAITSPIFSTGNIKKMKGIVEDSVFHMLEHLENQATDGAPVDIYKNYQEFTMDVISRVAMGQKESTQFNNPRLKLVKTAMQFSSRHPVNVVPTIADVWGNIGWRIGEALNLAFAGLTEMVRKEIKVRKGSKLFPNFAEIWNIVSRKLGTNLSLPFTGLTQMAEKKICVQETNEHYRYHINFNNDETVNDFIDLYLRARVDDKTFTNLVKENDEHSGSAIRLQKIEKKLSEEEIVANCLLFLLAGYDTTANSLAFLSWHLAHDTERFKKLQQEVDEICTDKEITYEQLQQCNYLDKAVKESLRLHPVAALANQRQCMKSCYLGDVFVEKGTVVVADVMSVHYDSEIWGNEPEKFIPERWDNLDDIPQIAFQSFGLGPRQCLGKRFGLMEAKLAICHIVRKFDLLTGPQSEDELKTRGYYTISPTSVTVYLQRRNF